MACAGIIGAENNQIGIRGVASGVKLLPVNIVPNSGYYDNYGELHQGFALDSDIGKAIVWASQRADVLSCSWGGGLYSQDIVNAIDTARTFGRDGKGCVVIFSSGNDYDNDRHYVNFPANVDGVLTVGAIDNMGNVWNYSQRGAELDLVAPSGDGNSNSDIVTTDRMGTLGYNPAETYGYDLANTNYTQRFGGTSAACPQVAGVVALMLSVRPDLTEAEVRTALQQTARDLGATGFDTTYGYGLVDAYAAVSSVVPHSILGDDYVYGHEVYSVGNLGDYLSVSWSLSGDNASNFTLQNDTPSLNQCRIKRVEGAGFSGSTSLTLTAHVIYNGTTIKTLTKQLVAPYISGPHIPCGFTTYIVESRPANSTVEWSSSGVNMGYDTDPSGLMPDDPTAYVIINNDYETIHGTLTATVKVNGNVVGTLTKQVDTGGEFSATWYQGNNSTPATLPNHAIIELTGGGHIYMQSNDFIGANVTHSSSGIMVQNWSHVGNTISFSPLIPAFWGGIIRIEGVVPNNCKKFDVRFTKIDPIPPLPLVHQPVWAIMPVFP